MVSTAVDSVDSVDSAPVTAPADVRRSRVPAQVRWSLLGLWTAALVVQIVTRGVPADRIGVLVWSVSGAAIAGLGRRRLRTVFIDFVPFAAVLIAWDYLRGISDSLGMPTWWLPQLEVSRWLFFGHDPTLWLQDHLRRPTPQWYDAVFSLVYLSFFVLPVGLAAVLWLRSRCDFYRWAYRYAAVSFAGFAVFALAPSAPPWAAARCSYADVRSHPYNPGCLHAGGRSAHDLLGTLHGNAAGLGRFVVRGDTRGLQLLHLHWASALVDEGRERIDVVAAVPSLHAAVSLLIAIFWWRRVRPVWRPVLAVYPLLMGLTLVYGAEHYVVDILVGWLFALAVTVVAAKVEPRVVRRLAR